MAKFYVQSGNVKRVINSASVERAAIWVVHQAMQQIAPQFSADEPRTELKRDEVVVLSDTILISEVGFESTAQHEIETFAAFRKWYALCETVGL